MKQQLHWDEKKSEYWLETLNDDGSIDIEELTSEQAAKWQAEHGY